MDHHHQPKTSMVRPSTMHIQLHLWQKQSYTPTISTTNLFVQPSRRNQQLSHNQPRRTLCTTIRHLQRSQHRLVRTSTRQHNLAQRQRPTFQHNFTTTLQIHHFLLRRRC